jgi:crotonobetainyl-CoA:carnitine CoA-transferase CaiB-like acyl-CoA transferase
MSMAREGRRLFPRRQPREKVVAIDFATEEGAALVRRMAADADVLVENFKVGGLDNSASMRPACAPSIRG